MNINCKMNSLTVLVTCTKVVLISTGQQYTKRYWMSIQIWYRSCKVLVPYSASRTVLRYHMLVSVYSVTTTVPFLYRHVYWVASVNWIDCLNRRYRYGALGMHYHILLRLYSQNCYTYNSMVKDAYSPCHKDACVQISIGNTEWFLRYKGVS